MGAAQEKQKKRYTSVKIALNGTDENPYHKMGFKMNPFPLIAKAEYSGIDYRLRQLAADPIPDVAYIRQKLEGCAPEFVEGCCKRFKKGEYVEFRVSWPED